MIISRPLLLLPGWVWSTRRWNLALESSSRPSHSFSTSPGRSPARSEGPPDVTVCTGPTGEGILVHSAQT